MMRPISILCTMPDRSVAIYTPAWACMKALTHGGGFLRPWMRQRSIDAMIRNGRRPAFAKAWVEAAIDGGMTDAEFYGAIVEKDIAPKGATAPELIADAPPDRWFRDAWTRSHNGGPIDIDLEKARRVHAKHILRAARAAENSEDVKLDEMLLGTPPMSSIDMKGIGAAINEARSLRELRRVWPRDLPKA